MPLKKALNASAAPQTPKSGELLEAAKSNDTAAVRDLLRRGADVNERNSLGNTPLMFAAWWENRKNVRLLIDQGADIDARDDLDQTAMDYLIRDGKVEMAALLDSAIEQRAEAKGQLQLQEKGQPQAQAKRMKKNRRLHEAAAGKQERLRRRAPRIVIRPA